MVFPRTLGVDGREEQVRVTASTGSRSRGLQREVEPPLVLTGESQSISGAVVEIGGQCDQQVFYGYVDQLLLGEEWCQSGILPALEYFARDVELGLGSEVWAVAGTAEDAMMLDDEGVDSRLATLQMEGELGTAAITRTAGQLLTDILEDGATYLPRLVPQGDTLVSGGYTIIIGDAQKTVITGEAARGLELLEGQPSGDVFVSQNGLVVELWDGDCEVTTKFQNDSLSGAVVAVSLSAQLVEYDQKPTEDELEELRQELSQRERERIESALLELQQVNGDAIGLGRQLGMASPHHWEKIEGMWEEVFPALPIEVTVDVTIGRD